MLKFPKVRKCYLLLLFCHLNLAALLSLFVKDFQFLECLLQRKHNFEFRKKDGRKNNVIESYSFNARMEIIIILFDIEMHYWKSLDTFHFTFFVHDNHTSKGCFSDNTLTAFMAWSWKLVLRYHVSPISNYIIKLARNISISLQTAPYTIYFHNTLPECNG